MAALSFGVAHLRSFTTKSFKIPSTPKISCVWDPEGVFKTPAQTGHFARLDMKKGIEKEADAKDDYERYLKNEKERREALRQARVIPDTDSELIEYFLDTEAQEIEYEIARLRPRLNDGFFKQLQSELGHLRFAMAKTEEMEDRVFELEALQKAILEGIEGYDKMQSELVKAKESLTKIFTSKDVNKTLLDMVELNELNMSLVTLLDENIASANRSDQKQAAEYMEKLRASVLKYVTV
ncbi:hypothetical protein SOVF_181510 [Spinacia oleracea]|uniref:Uncharacterized protein n=1 Tax=Spinacia oleracea TaxID=3562 RepID=A0A9R0K328_SPIOL|nr:uncharacterized protein LOC110795229 [Spinacia oleracea]KNA06393.1 hypothetical protein SOVF_181510 [Spinacia oleracea]